VKIPLQKPKAIFFDFDETLAANRIPIRNLFAQMYHQYTEQLGEENQDDFFTALRENAGRLWNSMFETQKSPESQLINCFTDSILSLNIMKEHSASQLAETMFNKFIELSVNNVRLQHDTLETLAELNANGFVTGIITNGIEQVQLSKIHSLDLHNKVDHLIVSAHARAHKPHAKVFNLALDKAGVNADQAWQVGDHPTNDVAGAIRAGLSGVYYNPNNLLLEDMFTELKESPTHVVKELNEVVSLALNS